MFLIRHLTQGKISNRLATLLFLIIDLQKEGLPHQGPQKERWLGASGLKIHIDRHMSRGGFYLGEHCIVRVWNVPTSWHLIKESLFVSNWLSGCAERA